MRSRRLTALGSIGCALAVVALWALVARAKLLSPVFLPSPGAAFDALWQGLADGELVNRTLQTVRRMALGWLLASIGGVMLGALVGLSARARRWLLPTLEFIRPLPASSLIPVGIALIGLTDGMVVAAVAFGSIWPVLLATVHGFSTIHPRLREVAAVMGIGRAAFALKFGLPNAMPDVLVGMKLSLTAALIVAIVGEMLSAQEGLGTTILLAARSFRASDLYAGVILLGAIGFAGNWALERVERHLLRWRNP